MKIEMGESLFYSWLRHVKECHIVQTNWKVSPQWDLQNVADLEALMESVDKYFSEKYSYSVFKKNASLKQVLQQGECDAVGISIQDGIDYFYTVDVAFHEGGLNYGSREETVMKVIAKTVRTAMCLWGYMKCKEAEIIFASPKINPAIFKDIERCIEEVNAIFCNNGFKFKARVIANDSFNNSVLQPILLVSDGIADTSELFLRSYQMYNMFARSKKRESIARKSQSERNEKSNTTGFVDESRYKELKIGKLAQVVLRRILQEGAVSEEEVIRLQQREYSKLVFDLQYPLIVKRGAEFEAIRYYAHPLTIHGEEYYLCSQWFETKANNDRPYLIKWIEEHESVSDQTAI